MGDLIAIVIIISVCVIGIFAIPISSIISQRRALKKYTGEEVEAAEEPAQPVIAETSEAAEPAQEKE